MSNRWHGVDLDGTLAYHDEWKGIEHVGDPVPLMARRVVDWLENGENVRIITARVSTAYSDREDAIRHIQDWTEKHFGVRLRVTCEKDFDMIDIWDDRAVRVQENTGIRIK